MAPESWNVTFVAFHQEYTEGCVHTEHSNVSLCRATREVAVDTQITLRGVYSESDSDIGNIAELEACVHLPLSTMVPTP